jgi:hypothetical protein
MLEAAAAMAAKGHIPTAEVRLIKAWISDLTHAGYKFPDLGQHPAKLPAAPSPRLTPHMVMAAPLNSTFLFPKRWCLHQDKVLVVNFNRLGKYNSIQQITAYSRQATTLF